MELVAMKLVSTLARAQIVVASDAVTAFRFLRVHLTPHDPLFQQLLLLTVLSHYLIALVLRLHWGNYA